MTDDSSHLPSISHVHVHVHCTATHKHTYARVNVVRRLLYTFDMHCVSSFNHRPYVLALLAAP